MANTYYFTFFFHGNARNIIVRVKNPFLKNIKLVKCELSGFQHLYKCILQIVTLSSIIDTTIRLHPICE